MSRTTSDDLDPWEVRIVLGRRLRRTLLIGGGLFLAWTVFQIAITLFNVMR